ncbi:MAG TPA: ABC transporter ATP-binding protein, partial [Chitinophagaceae bacterium]|nr:ABC transporter ATP-binding protein [Chitinophagaceae bacterium]
IIGKNGAGKSNLLKILSQVTGPTVGEIKVKGRIASLLEVGNGFHPELTGWENIYLNGAILGMTKTEIKRKFDEIVAFSGVERYIDTPVKRYSSGMYVRLAFAVAAHLEPEILIVDEVLAVGDAEFQEKCLGKMKAVSGEGRTVLFVSHNILAIKNICKRGLLMKNGNLVSDNTIDRVIADYVASGSQFGFNEMLDPDLATYNTGEGHIRRISLITEKNSGTDILYEEPIKLKVNFELYEQVDDFIMDVRILTKEGNAIAYAMPKYDKQPIMNLPNGKYSQHIVIENKLQPDAYFLNIGIHFGKGRTIHYFEKVIQIRVLSVGSDDSNYPVSWTDGYTRPKTSWRLENWA